MGISGSVLSSSLMMICLIASGGCFKTPQPACNFTCGQGSDCPDNYACAADNYCHLKLSNGELGQCSFAGSAPDSAVSIDASTTVIDGMPLMIDAPVNVCPALSPASDGSGNQDLVIAQIKPGDFFELYNNSAASISLAARSVVLTTNSLARAFTSADGAIAPRTYKSFAWSADLDGTAANGEMTMTTDGGVIVDYACWGPGTPRSDVVTANKWKNDCASALTAGGIKRKTATAGVQAADYDTVAAVQARNCMAP
jgi:hypothetical protein